MAKQVADTMICFLELFDSTGCFASDSTGELEDLKVAKNFNDNLAPGYCE